MKSKIIKILLFLAIIGFPLGAAKALDTKTGDSIYVAKGEIANGNFYAVGNTITIDGDISGDLIAAAQNITVNGRVEGDIIAAAQNITVNGETGGNIRVAGTSIILNGQVARNITAVGSNIVLGPDSQIGWDVFAAGMTLEIRGSIEGGLSGNADRALIAGKVGKDVNIKISRNISDSLAVLPEAKIGGNLFYTSEKPAQISNQANIGGQIEQKVPTAKSGGWLRPWVWTKLYTIFAAIIVGLLPVFFGKKMTSQITEKIKDKPARSLITGLIIMFVLPPVIFFLAFTIIGIPLALIASAWWLIGTYVAKIFTAIMVGDIILGYLMAKREAKPIWPLIIGVVVCWLLFAIPFVGWIIGLVAIWLGLGGMWSYASNQFRNI